MLLFLLLQSALMALCVFTSRPDRHWREWGAQEKQYEALAVSMAEGKLWLPETVPDSLLTLDNPYDPARRAAASAQSGDAYPVDVALYEGHYYVYFGIVPELLFFLPFRLMTGHTLPTWVPVLFCAVLTVPGAFLLVRELSGGEKRKEKIRAERHPGWTLFGTAVFLASSGLPFLAAFPSTYTMPVVEALCLGVWGLYAWMRRHYVAGSVLLSLIIGCRPQMAAVLLLAFPLFREEIRDGIFFRRTAESMRRTFTVILPFLLTGGIVLWYNAARFGSPFEFGYRYLLTSSNLTKQSVTAGKVLAGIWYELLCPMRLSPVFPWVQEVPVPDALRQSFYIEPLVGGCLAMYPVLLTAFVVLRRRACAPERQPGGNELEVGRVSLFLAAAVAAADIVSAGISQRYMADYCWLLCIPAVLALRTALEEAPQGSRIASATRIWFVLSGLFSLLAGYGCLLSDGRYFAMRQTNPAVFEALSRFFSMGTGIRL